jgi:hypothetical protein
MDTLNQYLNIIQENELKKYIIGKHNDVPDDQFDFKQLKMGIQVEYEHTDSYDIAKAIAKDHLMELPDYYTRLANMEKEGFKELGIEDSH